MAVCTSARRVAARYASGKIVAAKDVVQPLSAAVWTGDCVCLEGDNQKQADFLVEALASVDKARIHELHIVQSGVVLQANRASWWRRPTRSSTGRRTSASRAT
jgi:hypothetical protein